MIVKRNVGMSILFSIITCGIYGVYWFVSLTDEVNLLSGEDSTSGIMALLFSIITCGIYSFYWAYNMGKKMNFIQRSEGIVSSDNSVLYLILGFLGLHIVNYAIIQSEINNLLGNRNALN